MRFLPLRALAREIDALCRFVGDLEIGHLTGLRAPPADEPAAVQPLAHDALDVAEQMTGRSSPWSRKLFCMRCLAR